MTYQEAIKILSYDPATGIFTWVKTNKVAGFINDKGYVKIQIKGKSISAHRLAFLFEDGYCPEKTIQVDHINCIRHDNRWCNLRLASASENQRNERLRKNNTSGYKGVHFDNKSRKWRACAPLGGKQVKLGSFLSIEEARDAVINFRQLHHGDFCNHG